MTREAAIGKYNYDRFVAQVSQENGYNHDLGEVAKQWLSVAVDPKDNNFAISIDDTESIKSNEASQPYTEVKVITYRIACAVGNNREVIYEMYDDILRFYDEESSYFKNIFGPMFNAVPVNGDTLNIYHDDEYEIAEMEITINIYHRWADKYSYDTRSY